MGFCELLTLIFVVAKLFGVIQWGWWWVFAPLWIWVLIAVVFGLLRAWVED